jgi:hypothetical protein
MVTVRKLLVYPTLKIGFEAGNGLCCLIRTDKKINVVYLAA